MACLPWELRVQKAEDALGGYSKLRLARRLAEPHLQPQTLIQNCLPRRLAEPHLQPHTLIQLSSPRCSTRAVPLDAMFEESLCSFVSDRLRACG